ncbi:aspartate aminotransferase family protein [Actinoplanes lobatus]|uniref:(S)-3-amino-2-methylpropionate transaminase n=1 Tax=Actinoplanes lobatus TaxID=113568 RepID=A0A7W7HHH7_9ACTN|nr:4-aminobutyrate--2-oxoglutarate transaminase [Actinoplanes lobatus]MBB4750654.1 4-aminobutyrate aminotransferase/(S)-3-amino-2-methylpropionate transaminase [Actinoplanes lobatus]GGN69217.1 aspartate aminotransferase family protein [Actinoplanes lobatus]GIE44185.1 aspartate aminotransferase family protein [Actinoplanes lobatus]
MTSSEDLHKRRLAAVAKGVGSVVNAYVDHAKNGTITDVDGREWIDFASGIAVTNVGNAAPRVVEAVRAQVERFTHTCFMVAPYESYVAVCEQLIALTPGSFEKRAALFNSGAEAVENAVKIARHATGRPAVVVFDHAYHGRTNLTMALTAKNMPYKHRFGPFAPEVYRAPMSYPLRDGGLSGAEAARRAIDVIEKQVGGPNVAAVLIEPIQGEGGFVVPAPGFLPAIAAWAKANGAVFVADEIQTGFARTGQWFASEHEGLEPDLITTAKGMGGGLPIAGVVGRAELMDAVHAGGLGGTYGGNPIACAAALAAIETMRELDLCAAARRIESIIEPALQEMRDPGVAEVRGRGAMLAIELVLPGGIEPDPTRTARVSKACHDAGLLTLTCGTYGNVLRFLPPLVISDEDLGRGLGILRAALRS